MHDVDNRRAPPSPVLTAEGPVGWLLRRNDPTIEGHPLQCAHKLLGVFEGPQGAKCPGKRNGDGHKAITTPTLWSDYVNMAVYHVCQNGSGDASDVCGNTHCDYVNMAVYHVCQNGSGDANDVCGNTHCDYVNMTVYHVCQNGSGDASDVCRNTQCDYVNMTVCTLLCVFPNGSGCASDVWEGT